MRRPKLSTRKFSAWKKKKKKKKKIGLISSVLLGKLQRTILTSFWMSL